MANLGRARIEIDIEPIVKVFCKAGSCRHNLMTQWGPACNLKHITIEVGGTCNNYEQKGDLFNGKTN